MKNLTPKLVHELLEKIEIDERIVDEYGKKSQEVVLHYRFIGKVDELRGNLTEKLLLGLVGMV